MVRGQKFWGAIVALTFLLGLPFGAPSGAVPVPTPPPHARETPPDTPPPASTAANVLPFDTSLLLVLDDAVGSGSSMRGEIKRAHLKDALIVASKVLAPAGSPVNIDIIGAQGARAGDVYGYVDIAIEALHLSDGSRLPLRAPTSHLTVDVTAGHAATVGVEDTVGDIFIPGHMIYRALRRGRNVTLASGSLLRVRTVGTVSINARGEIAVATPAPISMPQTAPVADFKPLPFATAPDLRPNQRPTPYRATPSPEASPSPSPATTP